MHQTVYWYHCLDKHNGAEISSLELHHHLNSLHSGSTSQHLGKIPLVIGMPIMIGQNFNVGTGIVNGCVGHLKSIQFLVDGNSCRHATPCMIDTPSTSGEPLPHLAAQQSVILPDTVDLYF
ncbi:hypothetical protein C8R48DRAFT_600549, partial [Suillus tomentosus]